MADSLRVFHLIKGLGRGGAEVLLEEGLHRADRARFTYGYGYFLPWKDAVVPPLRAQGVEVVCFEAESNAAVLLSAFKVARYLKRWQPDVIHAHLSLSGVVARLVGRWLGVPIVYTEHNKMQHLNRVSRWLNVATWNWQEEAIAVSGDVADSIATYTDSPVPTRIVLNGVSLDRFDPAQHDGASVREEWGVPPEAPVVTTVAVFRQQKQLHHWLDAARRIFDERPDAHFFLVGEGELREDLEAQSRRLKLTDAVHFTGLQDNVKPYLAATDVYLMSSLFEGLPIALLEAAAMERPIVSTAVGGVPEVVKDGETGFLTEPGDVAALADATLRLLGDEALRTRTGQAARHVVADQFSMQRMQRDLERIYARVARVTR